RETDGRLINDPTRFNSEQSESIYLKATETFPAVGLACYDSLMVSMDVREIPVAATVLSDTFCQLSGTHLIPVTRNETAANPMAELAIQWFDEKGDSIANPINTDTTIVNAKSRTIKYTIRQYNKITGCYKDTVVPFVVNKAIKLNMEDLPAVCQPEVIDFKSKVTDYLTASTTTNITNIGSCDITYGKVINGAQTAISDAEASQIEYTSNIDSMLYTYTVVDGVCSASDSVYVTINQKPSTPIIENGLDTIYFCQSNGQLQLTASHSNDKRTTSIFWGDHKSTQYGDTIDIPSTPPTSQYIAFSKNVLTGCVSEDDTIIVIVKEAIKVTPLGNDGTMELCAGEEINLYEQAMASFTVNQTPNTTLIFNATENGYVVGENELSKVTRTKQDTSLYQFSIEDDQSKCTASNSLKLIYHQLPTFSIEGDDVYCEGNDVKLEAIGDERPVSYAWKIAGDEKTLNTTASFTYKEIMKDTTFILIEKLNGTTCADTVSKKITVNVNPARLADTVISICQDTSATSTEEINLGRSSSDISSYSIQWYQDDNTLFSNDETIQVEKTKSTAFKFEVETTNRNTGCVSPRSNVTVHVNPQITIGLDNPDTICQPFTYDLITNLAKSISGGTQPTYVRTELNGTVISNETAISESGLYEVYYTDDKHCDASKTISIQFHQQPGVPQLIGDTILCQGIGDVKLTAKKMGVNSVNQSFVWKNANGETTSDTLTLSTNQYGKTRYNLFAIDLKTKCLSEPDTFDFDVRESIGFKPIGLMEACYATTVDLKEKAEAAYFGSPEEKVISYYKVNESGNLSSIADPANIGASGKYVTKATEAISRCERMDTTEVVVYDSLAIATEGSTLICQGEEVSALSATNADSYTWYRENGDNATGNKFPYSKDVTKTETFRLVGEKKIGSLYCQDSIDVTIKVNANPITLSDTIFRFCQDTAGVDQPLIINKIERGNETIELLWTDEQGETIFKEGARALTSIKENGETRYYVYQKNTKTHCTSEKAAIDVTVLPQIRVSLKDTTTCEPNIINLVELSEKAGTAKDHTSDINVAAYELMQNGAALDKTSQAEAITESGQYRITFQYEDDGLTCQSTGVVQLTFNRQPNRPNIADQNFCQNTGDYELKGKTNTTDVQLLWEDLSIYPSRQDTGKSTISTEIATQKLFLVRQVHVLNGCVSEADSAMVTVYPAITALDKDTAICYGESVDLNLFAQSSYQGGTPKYSVNFKNKDGQSFDAENVTKSNTYFAYFSDSMNVCQDTASLIIDVNQPIILSIAGGGDACTGQAVTLTVEGAEQYEWSNGEKTPSIALTSEETGSRTLSVEGRSTFHDIYCYADTSVEIIFHNAVKPRELTFDTCARNIVTIDDIVRKNNVTEHIDTIWNITDNIRYSNLSQNIGKSGQYEVAVHNDEGCAAHHTLTINMHQVDNLKVEKQESTYCYGSLANFTATGENAREYEWEDLTNNTVTTGATYNEPIYERSEFRLIATEKELGCKDTIEFSVDAFPKKELTITGNKNACRDSLVILSVEDALIDVRWKLGDSIMTEKNIRFIADHNDSISVSGIDENGCLTTETFIVNVAYLEDPAISYSTIDDTEYALSDDVKEVEFKETTTPSGSDLYKFTWSFGDGRTWIDSTSNEVSHVYNDTLIHSRRDIPVELIVEHQYGCKKSTSTILKIDPFLFVPNTMIADGSYIFMENYDVQIYDRVGTLIYQGNGWDGTYKGEPASEDTYFYSLTYFEKGEKKLRTGYITLVR
ncbi:MAG: gliding motility-associated C-terminal domain-containing protein, partial [Paludibacteraceae bacterium]|nr:gliding motility-associated C-terminal domain-containing protein [Paludibacteraceae bacterium]